MTTITLNDAEAAMVRKALDTYIRVHMGRAEQAMDKVTYSGVRVDGRQLTIEETHEAQALLRQASEILTGVPNGGPSIFNTKISNEARLAYRVTARMDGDTLREGMVSEDGTPT